MSEIKKIQEQEDVINSLDQNLVVSASAGSGKTSVMIRKIVDYILNHDIKVKDILVLTYTNFASEEMRQRLVSSLKEVAPNRQDIFEQLDDLPLADISTFDSFCQKIVKKYFYAINIDPSFSVLDNALQTIYQNRALKNAIDVYREKNPERYFSLFNCFADNRTDKNIYDLILSIYNFSCSIIDFEKFKDNALSLFENNKAEKIYKNFINYKLSYVIKNLTSLHKICQSLELEKHCKYIVSLLVFAKFLLENNDFEKIIDYCTSQTFPTKPSVSDEYMDKIVVQKDILKSVVDTLKGYVSGQVYLKSKQYCKDNTTTLLDLVSEFKKQYDAIKKQKNLYDFNDIERFTISILEHEDINSQVKSKYKKIFVDEFQDANLIQEKILSLIKSEDNLFLVGDLKQAIYGFRQSNSKIFERVIKDYEKENKTSGKSNALKLNSNFRTSKYILNFVNEIFSQIMTQKSAHLNYEKDAQLHPLAEFLDEDYNVELDVVYDDTEQSDEKVKGVYSVSEDMPYISNSDKVEAMAVAEKISTLLGQKIYDINKKEYRDVKYSDICVLFRTRSQEAQFVEVFGEYGIPLIENSNLDLEQTYDVKVLINAIKICENFNDDYTLASVMMSPLFDFSSDEMLKIRQQDKSTFYECVKSYDFEDDIKQKIDGMQSTLKKFYDDYTFKGLYFALTKLNDLTNYTYKLSYLSNGLSRKNNVLMFISSFVNSSFNFAVGSYISFLKQNTRNLKVTSEASSFDCVTLTTMHASKGLEWPIVFCVSLGQDFNKSPKTSKVMLNEELGIGIKYFDELSRKKYESIFYDVIKQKNAEDDYAEKLRLLYVALTRAKNKLILIGSTNKLSYEKFKSEHEILSQRTYLDLIVRSLDNKSIDNLNNQKSCNMFDNAKLVLNVLCQSAFSGKKEQKISALNAGEDLGLSEYIKLDYKNQLQTFIAQKNSVSSVLKDEYEYTSQNFQPHTLKLDEHLSTQNPAEIGIVYHKILESINYDDNIDYSVIENIISKINQQKIYDQNVLNAVDKNLALKNALIVQKLAKGHVVLKEHSFVMQLPYSEIENSTAKEKVLVQGVCDLVIKDDDSAILVDYKFSSKTPESLLKTYNKQLYLYKLAIEKGLFCPVKKVYILSLKSAQLIEATLHK